MQATATVKQAQRNQIRIAAIIVILLGVLGTGAVVAAITRNGDVTPGANVSAVAGPNTNADFRFAEMNMLPEAAAVRPMTYQQYRFREINTQLPEVAPVPLMSVERWRFLEINTQLPEAAPVPLVSFERWHFLETNVLPGDDAQLVAPFSDQRGERY